MSLGEYTVDGNVHLQELCHGRIINKANQSTASFLKRSHLRSCNSQANWQAKQIKITN